MKTIPALFALLMLGASAVSSAGTEAGKPATTTVSTDAVNLSDAEVRKIDKDAKKITLKHGELKNLDMPAMTMVFQVKDAAVLDKVNVGDKIKFKAEKSGGGFAASEIKVVK